MGENFFPFVGNLDQVDDGDRRKCFVKQPHASLGAQKG